MALYVSAEVGYPVQLKWLPEA